MASKTVVSLVDDVTGGPATATHRLSLDGVTVDLNLSDENSARLYEFVEPFLSAGRRVSTRGAGVTRSATTSTRKRPRADVSAVRAWAHANGYDIGARGRIPTDVHTAYTAAQAQA